MSHLAEKMSQPEQEVGHGAEQGAVPTRSADARILPRATGFITDVGMTGPYDSVLGMKKDLAIKRFLTQTPHKYETAMNDVRLCGIIAEVEVETGKCVKFEQLIFPKF